MLIILAVCTLIAGFVLASEIPRFEEAALLGVGAAVFLIILYVLTRKHQIQVITDGGGKLAFQTNGMKNDKILKFVNQVEQATKQRRESL